MVYNVDTIYINYKNDNNRIYDILAIQKIISDFKENINKYGVVFGELSHPDTFEITPGNVSHKVLDMWIECGILKAKIEILDTKNGNLLKELINDCVFSSRSICFVINNIVSLKKFITLDAINYKDDPYYKIRIRKKLKRILNEE